VAARCPGANNRDLQRALEVLLEVGSVEEPIGGLGWLAGIDETDVLQLSEAGRLRLAADE
jgi:hypothetical protein